MRIHLTLLDANGATQAEGSFDSSVVTVGNYEHAMFLHAALPPLELRTDGVQATVRPLSAVSSTDPQRLSRRNVIPLKDGWSLQVHLYPRPENVPRRKGACPACGDNLTERRSGGAYRSIAKTERGCPACGAVVLSLDGTRQTHGRFSDRSESELVPVTVAARCPQCLESMSQATYVFDGGRFGHAKIEVERCAPCALVLLDREDQAQLAREAR